MKKALVVALLVMGAFSAGPVAKAAANNTFSGAVFLGDSYAPNNFRLSFGSFDIGLNDMASLYAGSRAWLGSYYAGFGLGVQGSIYGMVGYEWRFLPWLGLSAEFDGNMAAQGDASGRVYIGLVAGW